MKTLPRIFSNTLYLSCLVAVVVLIATTAHSKKLSYKVIAADRSSILLDIKGYETRHFATGWIDGYTQKKFRAFINDKNLSLGLYVTVLEGQYWRNTGKDIEKLVRRGSKFRRYITNIIEKSAHSKANSFDSNQEAVAMTYELSHYQFKFCYFAKWTVGFGESEGGQFNPLIMMEICTPNDLGLSIENPEKFFILNGQNESIRLDLNYQNLRQKIAALKTSVKQPISTPLPSVTIKKKKAVQPTAHQNGLIDRLKALKKLEDAGLISKEEAAEKRKEILKNL